MNVLYLLLGGLISGVLSYFSIYAPLGLWVGPGLVFGLITGYLFYKRGQPFGWRLLSFIVCSVGAYYAAVQTTLYLPDYDEQLPVALIIGGLVGTLVLMIGLYMLVSRIALYKLIILVILGGILGLSWYIIPEGLLFDNTLYGPSEESFLSLYIFWQMGMMTGIGLVTPKKLKNNLTSKSEESIQPGFS